MMMIWAAALVAGIAVGGLAWSVGVDSFPALVTTLLVAALLHRTDGEPDE